MTIFNHPLMRLRPRFASVAISRSTGYSKEARRLLIRHRPPSRLPRAKGQHEPTGSIYTLEQVNRRTVGLVARRREGATRPRRDTGGRSGYTRKLDRKVQQGL